MGKIQKIKQERKRAEVEAQLKRYKNQRLAMRTAALVLVLAALAFGGIKAYGTLNFKWDFTKVASVFKKKTTQTAKTNDTKGAPAMEINVNKTYLAHVETTDGNFTLQLNAKDTPKTVNNFVVLSKRGFYNNTVFHRIIKDFMIQGGDPKGDGTGGPGYKFDDEKFSGDYTPGTLAMANSGANTNGSQFFIMTSDYSGGKLPKNYTIFGKVSQGMDTITKIAATPVEASASGESSKPTKEVKITKVTIEEK